jgi:hypothetical protein
MEKINLNKNTLLILAQEIKNKFPHLKDLKIKFSDNKIFIITNDNLDIYIKKEIEMIIRKYFSNHQLNFLSFQATT